MDTVLWLSWWEFTEVLAEVEDELDEETLQRLAASLEFWTRALDERSWYRAVHKEL